MLAICTASSPRGTGRGRCLPTRFLACNQTQFSRTEGRACLPSGPRNLVPVSSSVNGDCPESFGRGLGPPVWGGPFDLPGWLVAGWKGRTPAVPSVRPLRAESSGCLSGDLPHLVGRGESFRRAAVGGRYLDRSPGDGKEIFTLLLISAGRARNCG
jgi:hypothetical protein